MAALHVVIIGAGVVGITTAWQLQKQGVSVTLVERQAEAGVETSFGNAALQHPSLVDPWNAPGVGWDLLRWIGRDDAPMLLHLSKLPSLALWGLRFLANSTPERHKANTLKNLRLALLARREMSEIRAATNIQYGWKTTGVISAARTPETMRAAIRAAELVAPHGVTYRTLSRDETVSLEPALAPIAEVLEGSVYFPDEERCDSYLFCREMTRLLQQRGVTFHFNTALNHIRAEGGRIRSIQTTAGEIETEVLVLAAGSYSPAILSPLGIDLPVRPAKGYSATIRCKGNPHKPNIPVSDSSVHAAVTPLDDERVRVAGTAEFAGYDTTVRQPRVDNLLSLLQKIYPKLSQTIRPEDISPWAGLRPLSPTLSPSPCSDLLSNSLVQQVQK